MSPRRFSSGLPSFDDAVGGFVPGDSILSFTSSHDAISEFLSSFIEYAGASRIPLVYISIQGSFSRLFSPDSRLQAFALHSKKQLPTLRRFLAAKAKRSYIILDDLGQWKKPVGSEQRVLEIFREISRSTALGKSLLICPVLRSEFSRGSLAGLKDSASVALDFVIHGGNVYCAPIQTRGRYAPSPGLPFLFDRRKLRSRRGAQETEAPAGSPEVSAAQTAAMQAGDVVQSIDYEALFHAAGEPMVLFDIVGETRIVNERCERFLGYSRSEWNSISLRTLISGSDWFRSLRFLATLRRRKRDSLFISLRRKDGQLLQCQFVVSLLAGSFYAGILHDISGQQDVLRKLQQWEGEYRALLDRAPVGIAVLSDSRVVYSNTKLRDLLRYDSNSSVQNVLLKQLLVPQGVRAVQAASRTTSGEIQPIETVARTKDAQEIPVQISLQRILFLAKEALQLSFADISKQRSLVDALTQSERRYRVLADGSHEAVALLEAQRIVYANAGLLNLLGKKSPEELIGADFASILDEQSRSGFVEFLQKRHTAKHQKQILDVVIADEEGSRLSVEISAVPVVGGIGADFMVFVRDVTQKRKMETELGQLREEMELLREIIPKLQSTLDYKKLPFSALHRVMEVLSWGMGAIFLRDGRQADLRLAHERGFPESVVRKLQSLETDEGIGGYCAKTLEPHHFLMQKYPSFLPHRALFRDAGITEICFIPLVADESLVGLILLASKKEAVERKQTATLLSALGNNLGGALWNARALSEIRETELHKTQLINSSPDVLYTGTLSGSFVTVNATIEKLVGYPPREFSRTPTLWLRLVHPDDKRILLERTTRLAELPRQTVYEYRVLPKGKAVYRWVRDVMTVVQDEHGKPVSIFGTITDMTDQKILVDRLQTENAIQLGIVEGMEDGIAAFDRRLVCIAWNPSLERMTGIAAKSALGKSAAELLPKFEEASLGKLFSDVLEGAVVTTPDIQYRHHGTQKTGYFLGRFSPMRGSGGTIVGVVGIIIDVSAQKHLQDEMRESDQILTNVIDTMGDMLVITDLRGRVLQVNRAFLRVLGYSRAEALDTDFPYPWLIEDEMGRFVLWTSTIRERTWLHDFDMTWRTKDLRLIPVSLSTTLLRNSLGEPFAMLNIARDITERTNLARGLEHRNKQIEAINRIISKANQTTDVDEIFSTLAKEIDGLLPAEMITLELLDEREATLERHMLLPKKKYLKEPSVPLERSATRLVVGSKRPLLIPDIGSTPSPGVLGPLFKGLQSFVSLPIIVKENVYGTLMLGSLETHTFSDEDIQLLSPIVQQLGSILDRLRLFKQVTADAAYVRTLLDSMESVVCTIDAKLSIREVNNAWYSFMREMGAAGVDDYRGLPLYDVLPSEHLRTVYRNVAAQMLRGEMRAFLEEFTHETPDGDKTYQLTVNPMVIGRQIIGLVFTHTDITSVKKTEEDLKRNNEQLLVLNEIATLINSTLDFEQILREAIPLFRRMMQVEAILVYLTDENARDLRLAGQIGFDPVLYPSIRILEQKKSVTGDVVARREALYIEDDVTRDMRVNAENRKVLEHYGIRSMAAIPIVAKESVLGALDIFSSQPHDYSDRERQVLSLAGNQLGVAIKNTQLYNEIRSQLTRLTVLYELSQKLTSTLNIEEIFQTTCEHVRDIVACTGFAIDLYNAETKVKTPAFSVEIRDGEERFISSRGQPVPVEQDSLEGRVVRGSSSYLSQDLHAVCIPMMSKGTIIGIITIRGNEETTYSDNQRILLESIGNLTAIALEKGKLYEETLQKSLEIERRNKELDDFTYVVSHDLKEPLISIEGFSRILQTDYREIVAADGKEYLDSIVGSTTRMKGLIDDLLLLSRVSRPSESFKNVSTNDLVREITTDMEYTFRKRNVSIVVPETLPVIFGNATQLKIVFRNLIGNAVKFNDNANPTVTIGFHNTGNNSYLFSVNDNGIGIEKEFFEKIFIIFQRLHRREEYEGSGAGLAIVKKIIELHKGKIWVESEPGRGSTFFFTIPKPLSGEP